MMDLNPYAAPRRTVEMDTTPSDPGIGPSRDWEIGEVLTEAWEVYKLHWPVLVGVLVVTWVILVAVRLGISFSVGTGIGSTPTDPSPLFIASSLGAIVAQQLVTMFLQVGMRRVYLTAVRGQTPDFGALFGGGGRYLASLVSSLLMGLAVGFGFLLLIVPGIIVLLGLYNSGYFVADTELSAIECLKASWNTISGQKGKYFAFSIVSFFVNVAGFLACGVGLLVSIPVTMLAASIVYTRVSGRGGEVPVAAQPAF